MDIFYLMHFQKINSLKANFFSLSFNFKYIFKIYHKTANTFVLLGLISLIICYLSHIHTNNKCFLKFK